MASANAILAGRAKLKDTTVLEIIRYAPRSIFQHVRKSDIDQVGETWLGHVGAAKGEQRVVDGAWSGYWYIHYYVCLTRRRSLGEMILRHT